MFNSVRRKLSLDHLVLGGLLLTVALLPLQSFSAEVSIGMCLLLLLLWGGQVVAQKRLVVVWTPVHWLLLVFLGIVLVQLIPWPFQIGGLNSSQWVQNLPAPLNEWSTISLDTQTTAQAAAVLAALIGLFFIAANLMDTERRVVTVVNGLIIIGAAISFLGVLDLFSPPGDPILRGGINFLGLYYHSLQRLSGFLEMIFPLPLALTLAGGVRRDQRVLYGLVTVVIGGAIVMADSTGALLAVAVEVMGFVLLMVRQRPAVEAWTPPRRWRIWAGFTAAVIIGTIAGGVVWLGAQTIPQTVASDVTQNLEAAQGLQKSTPAGVWYYSRAGIWKGSLPMIIDRPLLGVGFGVYSLAYTRYDPGSGLRLANAVHNDYLQVVCETGLIGGGAMILFLGCLIRSGRRALHNESQLGRAAAVGAIVGCLGILVHSLVDFHLQAPGAALLFFILIALLISIERLAFSENHARLGRGWIGARSS
jgi:O-antigen ligase